MALDRTTVEKANEWVTWFNYHSDKVAYYPLEQKVEWLLKAINGAYEVMTMMANDVHKGRRNPFLTEGGIMLPAPRFGGGKRASG